MMNHESQSIYPVSAKSMGPVRVVCLSKETFQKHWKNNLLIQGRLNSLLYQRMVLIQDDKALFSSPLKVRVANLLLRHLDQSEVQSPQTPSIILTRQEIADSLGVAVESVIRLMRDWISDGTIERDEELRLETINVPKLLEHAQS
jgi:CRP-like cAMP-binding protein